MGEKGEQYVNKGKEKKNSCCAKLVDNEGLRGSVYQPRKGVTRKHSNPGK